MKLKRSTVDDVKARFEFNKQKRQEKVKEYSLKERLQDAKEEQERMTAYSSQVSCIQLTKNCPEYKVRQKKNKTNSVLLLWVPILYVLKTVAIASYLLSYFIYQKQI